MKIFSSPPKPLTPNRSLASCPPFYRAAGQEVSSDRLREGAEILRYGVWPTPSASVTRDSSMHSRIGQETGQAGGNVLIIKILEII